MFKSQQLSSRVDVPDSNRVINSSCRQSFATGEKRCRCRQERVTLGENFELLAGAGFPGSGRAVSTGGHNVFSVGRESGGENGIDVAFQNLTLQDSDFRILADIPLADTVVTTSRENDLITFSKGDRSDRSVMTAERFQKLTAFRVPQPDRVVLAAADDADSILRERDRSDWSFMSIQTTEFRRRNNTAAVGRQPGKVVRPHVGWLPDEDSLVVSAGHNRIAVR
jgi:hypothetical protein